MAAPLAPDYREVPLWHAGVTLPEAALEPRPLPRTADVVVVGGGYCGLMAAGELARRGRHVVLVEAGPLGNGASTRNGGMIIPELKRAPRVLERRFGPLGRRLVDAVFDAVGLVERLVDEWGIDCDYERVGGVLLAHHPRRVEALRRMQGDWHDLGAEARFLDREALTEEVGSSAYLGGLVLTRVGAIQPAAYHAGLARAALDAGVELHAVTRATAVGPRAGGGFRVSTSRGDIDTGDVLMATNAYADGVLAPLRRRVLPVGSFIVATEPLDTSLRNDLIPRGRMLFDTKYLLAYWRLSPDGRMVFGGRTSLNPTTVARARDALYRRMLHVHPQLAGVCISYAWGGNVALTLDRLPHCGRFRGIAYATGCNGTGIALATWFGARMAAWLAGESDAPVFAQLPFRRIPLHALRNLWLPPVGVWFRLLDRLGR